MKTLIAVVATLVLFVANDFTFSAVLAAENAYRAAPSPVDGPNISEDFLQQARKYRAEGRYELARQSYAQALSTCHSN